MKERSDALPRMGPLPSATAITKVRSTVTKAGLIEVAGLMMAKDVSRLTKVY